MVGNFKAPCTHSDKKGSEVRYCPIPSSNSSLEVPLQLFVAEVIEAAGILQRCQRVTSHHPKKPGITGFVFEVNFQYHFLL